MFMQTLRHGMAAVAAAAAVAGVFAMPAAAAEPDPGQAQCRLTAEVVVVDTGTMRALGRGAVVCPAPVYQANVAVELSRDNLIVARGRNVCQNQAGCRVEVVAANPAGAQQWCARATGSYQLSPLGPVVDLGSQRACRLG